MAPVPAVPGWLLEAQQAAGPCPRCGVSQAVLLIGRFPSRTLVELAEQGTVELLGCCLVESSPDYRCVLCEQTWQEPACPGKPVAGGG